MNSYFNRSNATWIVGLAALMFPATANAQEAKQYDSPDAALAALSSAASSPDSEALTEVFGSKIKELVSGDEVSDTADLEQFAQNLETKRELIKNEDGTMTVLVGERGTPFAVPLVTKNGKWYFDTAAGIEEILNRRVGKNELSAMAVCRAYWVAQREYYAEDHDGEDVLEYAQRLESTAGKKDGLFWPVGEGETMSPLGELVAQAQQEGYKAKAEQEKSGPQPYHGYIYRVITRQEKSAPGGAVDYVTNGNMIAGHALLAYPATYGNSGVMTFQVNANGKIYERDLGDETAKLANEMTSYDLSDGWKVTAD